jgi:hypothetical protein
MANPHMYLIDRTALVRLGEIRACGAGSAFVRRLAGGAPDAPMRCSLFFSMRLVPIMRGARIDLERHRKGDGRLGRALHQADRGLRRGLDLG